MKSHVGLSKIRKAKINERIPSRVSAVRWRGRARRAPRALTVSGQQLQEGRLLVRSQLLGLRLLPTGHSSLFTHISRDPQGKIFSKVTIRDLIRCYADVSLWWWTDWQSSSGHNSYGNEGRNLHFTFKYPPKITSNAQRRRRRSVFFPSVVHFFFLHWT